MEKYLPISLILVGIILIITGAFRFLNPSEYLWQKKNANLTKVSVETKNTGGKLKSRTIMSYEYKVGDLKYQGVYFDDWNNSQNSNDQNKEKSIIIYYNNNQPNISFIKRPKEGVYRMAIGLILIIMGFLFYFSSNNEIKSSNKQNSEINDILVSSELQLL